MSKKKAETIEVACHLCGQTRRARPATVRGYDVLICQSHRTTHMPDLDVPEGHHLVIEGGTVAGYFTGLRFEKDTPATTLSLWRAQALAAAAAGRPAPPRPDVEDPWTALTTALTKHLSPEGWEIADAALVDKGRHIWQAKIYTDYGWAGFLDGTPRQIARDLADLRAEAEQQVTSAGLRCPTCKTLLNPLSGAEQCDCGSTAWTPAAWTSPVESITGALTYLDDVPEQTQALDDVLVALMLVSGEDNNMWPGEPGTIDDDFTGVAAAMRHLVPEARWGIIHDRLHAVIPLRAHWQHTAPAALLGDAAAYCGYTISWQKTHGYGRHWEPGSVWFITDEDADEDTTPDNKPSGNIAEDSDPIEWPPEFAFGSMTPDGHARISILLDTDTTMAALTAMAPRETDTDEPDWDEITDLLMVFTGSEEVDGWTFTQEWDHHDQDRYEVHCDSVSLPTTTGGLADLLAQGVLVGQQFQQRLLDEARRRFSPT